MSHRVLFITSIAAIAGTALLLGACASHNASTSGGKYQAHLVGKAGKAKSGDKLVCFRRTKTGSHIAQMYCMTRAQYREAQKEARESNQQLQDYVDQGPKPKCNTPDCQ